uniref:zinc transporter ZIP10-like n=1 Tax=Myxine glutinosa TaxID=7769 RepID=UPI00358F520A
MTVRQAMVYNLLSASLGYLGMIIGTEGGQYTHTVTLWIFAITAGRVLYVALVDMLPEMLHCEVCSHNYGRLGCFLLQNLGLLVRFAAMLLIALYEESILVSIKF